MLIGNSNQGAQTAVKQTQVSAAISGLSHQIEMLESRLEVLATRLQPVLNPSQKPVGISENGKEETKPQLVAEIDRSSERISGLRNSIDEILNRLEI